MAERDLIERLDDAIEALLGTAGQASAVADPEVAMLMAVAADLRELPRPDFKTALRRDLIQENEEDPMSSTAVVGIRPGFHTITPYLIVENASALIDFLKRAFAAEEVLRVPGAEGRIMHAEVKVGDSMIEISDATPEFRARTAAIHLYVDDIDSLYRRALAAGAQSIREPADQAYGDRDASLRDAFGNHWYLGTHQENVTEEELMQRFSGAGTRPRKDPAVAAVPPGFRTVTPFLHPKGARRLIDFMKEAFGAVEAYEPTVMPDGTVAHAALRIGDSIIELGEAHGEFGEMPSTLHVYVPDVDATYERALKAGATSLYVPNDTPYGERNAGLVDPSGNMWFPATPR